MTTRTTPLAYYARFKSTKPIPTPAPLIKEYPVTLRLRYLCCDIPAIIEFNSAKKIENFLSERREFLMDAETGYAILCDQTEKIDPSITYDVVGCFIP